MESYEPTVSSTSSLTSNESRDIASTTMLKMKSNINKAMAKNTFKEPIKLAEDYLCSDQSMKRTGNDIIIYNCTGRMMQQPASAGMFCHHCGARYPVKSVNFCPSCGVPPIRAFG
ncbi:unnamed protein product [Protopolystoma xenopodis]|uniref:Zinc-ribbon domain-containing protein n=1 Tax=Protopolystoma xenopodis TaxID=117903 RepID=A0A3S5CQW6_9PLAT|nr:unnamed protein product [Protopolystoma xenopodis]